MYRKNPRALEKISTELTTVRQMNKHKIEIRKIFHARVCEFLIFSQKSYLKLHSLCYLGMQDIFLSTFISNFCYLYQTIYRYVFLHIRSHPY